MTAPFPLAEPAAARLVDGLPDAIDTIAEAGPGSHRFLRRAWYAAALAAYGGTARTVLVEAGGRPVLAVPLVPIGPTWLKVAAIPGSYWPFRSPVADSAANPRAYTAAAAVLARNLRALRIGPVQDGDPVAEALVDAAHAAGWRVVERDVGESWLLDLTEQPWPRTTTLRKNRFHEKHLAGHGALEWSWLEPRDWPGGFDVLAEVERSSWHGGKADAKFSGSHGAFWRAAATDPVIAQSFHAALLRVDGRPAAFSFDIDAGPRLYAVANSYDPQYAKHSPGKLLQYRNLVAARDRGATLVDWGAGDSGYKRTLGAVAGPRLRDWLLFSPRVPSYVARLAARRWRRSGVAV